MPIRIERITEEVAEEIAWLCDDEWSLPAQVSALNDWLEGHGNRLDAADYVADVGFSPREGAAGGAATLGVESMSIMAKLGMQLLLSEYPEFEDR